MATEQKIQFASPASIVLAGVLHRPENPGPRGVVICHGMMSSKDSPKHTGIAQELAKRGFYSMRFDFSGRGQSQGDLLQLSFSRQVTECLAAIEQLTKVGVIKIGLVGSSMGGAVAVLTAAQTDVAALATMAAVGLTDLLPERAVGKQNLSQWRQDGSIRIQDQEVGYALVEDSYKIDLPKQAQEIKCPWLILHGEQDEVIPTSDARILHRASGLKATLEIIARADHRFSNEAHRRQITNRIVDFLDQSITE
ncbi:MAG: alpha/beta fold hydrolase [Deltaproteobacteria bacterium]|nr:alpha/beta fold hydrolase [Deltaproteobacteria bacterium]